MQMRFWFVALLLLVTGGCGTIVNLTSDKEHAVYPYSQQDAVNYEYIGCGHPFCLIGFPISWIGAGVEDTLLLPFTLPYSMHYKAKVAAMAGKYGAESNAACNFNIYIYKGSGGRRPTKTAGYLGNDNQVWHWGRWNTRGNLTLLTVRSRSSHKDLATLTLMSEDDAVVVTEYVSLSNEETDLFCEVGTRLEKMEWEEPKS